MVSPLEQRVLQISEHFILGYLLYKGDEIRFPGLDPESGLAKSLEGYSLEEQENLLCLSMGVARAILYALENGME